MCPNPIFGYYGIDGDSLEVSGRRHTLTTAFESPILIREAMFPRRSPRRAWIFLTFVVAVLQGLTASV